MPRKTLLIGWGAADWKVIHDLIGQGRMRHTQRLIERGTMGDLATLHPVLSPMLWASIATDKRPFKHGILGFTEPTPDGLGIQPVSQLARTTKALWNIFHQHGMRQHVISWWPSHPVEPIEGVMVSNHFAAAVGPPEQPWPVAPGMVHPPRLADTLAGLRLNPNELLPEQVLPFVPLAAEIDQDRDRRLAALMKILAECVSVHAEALCTLEHEPSYVAAVFCDAIDHFCHGFMKYRAPWRPQIPEQDFQPYGGVVDMAYAPRFGIHRVPRYRALGLVAELAARPGLADTDGSIDPERRDGAERCRYDPLRLLAPHRLEEAAAYFERALALDPEQLHAEFRPAAQRHQPDDVGARRGRHRAAHRPRPRTRPEQPPRLFRACPGHAPAPRAGLAGRGSGQGSQDHRPFVDAPAAAAPLPHPAHGTRPR